MALDFPASPTNGQIYGAYTYDSTKGAWNVTPQTQASVTTSDTAPVNPKSGDQWFYTVDGTMFVYYSDGTSSQWVEQPKAIAGGYSYYRSPNYIFNSAFDIWQRGTTGTPTSAATRYVADRYETYRAAYAAGLTVSRQTATDAALLPNIQYCMRVQRTAANATTGVISAAQALESANSIPLAGKTVTLSFYARAGANYSSASSALSVSLQTGTGTDQPLGAATPIGAFATGAAAPISQTATLTTSWQRFSYSGTIATSATQVGTVFTYTPVGTAGANDYFEITGIMLEEGTAATTFRRQTPSIQAELAACQRYYFRLGPYAVPTRFCMGQAASVTSGQFHVQFPVRMRTAPTAIETSGVVADFGIVSSGSGVALSGIPTFAYATVDTTTFTATSTYPSANSATTLYANANTPYLAWSAEL